MDLFRDPASCFWVDDKAGGAAPKLVSDSNVRHATGSTTCAAAGRPSTCALVAPGERVWLAMSSIDPVSIDYCRLLASPFSRGVCSTTTTDLKAGGVTVGRGAGYCYGRLTDGGLWHERALEACTPNGGSNGPSAPPPPPPAPADLVINEFQAGNGGWVEIYNPNNTQLEMAG